MSFKSSAKKKTKLKNIVIVAWKWHWNVLFYSCFYRALYWCELKYSQNSLDTLETFYHCVNIINRPYFRHSIDGTLIILVNVKTKNQPLSLFSTFNKLFWRAGMHIYFHPFQLKFGDQVLGILWIWVERLYLVKKRINFNKNSLH